MNIGGKFKLNLKVLIDSTKLRLSIRLDRLNNHWSHRNPLVCLFRIIRGAVIQEITDLRSSSKPRWRSRETRSSLSSTQREKGREREREENATIRDVQIWDTAREWAWRPIQWCRMWVPLLSLGHILGLVYGLQYTFRVRKYLDRTQAVLFLQHFDSSGIAQWNLVGGEGKDRWFCSSREHAQLDQPCQWRKFRMLRLPSPNTSRASLKKERRKERRSLWADNGYDARAFSIFSNLSLRNCDPVRWTRQRGKRGEFYWDRTSSWSGVIVAAPLVLEPISQQI